VEGKLLEELNPVTHKVRGRLINNDKGTRHMRDSERKYTDGYLDRIRKKRVIDPGNSELRNTHWGNILHKMNVRKELLSRRNYHLSSKYYRVSILYADNR